MEIVRAPSYHDCCRSGQSFTGWPMWILFCFNTNWVLNSKGLKWKRINMMWEASRKWNGFELRGGREKGLIIKSTDISWYTEVRPTKNVSLLPLSTGILNFLPCSHPMLTALYTLEFWCSLEPNNWARNDYLTQYLPVYLLVSKFDGLALKRWTGPIRIWLISSPYFHSLYLNWGTKTDTSW